MAEDPGRLVDSETSSYSRWYFGLCGVLALCLGIFNWVVDPLQFYRKASLYPPVFSENQRYQRPGIAKHYPYEIVILGDSHAENVSPAQVERVLGAPAVNLSIAGSSAYEQRLIAEKALETGRVRRVLWIVGRIPFRKEVDFVVERWGEFPFHLYAEGPRTYPRYLLSLDTLRLSTDALRGSGESDLEHLNTWHEDFEFSKRRLALHWLHRVQQIEALQADERAYRRQDERIRANIHENLAATIGAHPDVRFDVVFPPYSAVSYLADDRQADWMFEERVAYKRELVRALAPLANADVHDFQVAKEIIFDLENYKDLEHFSRAITDRVVEGVARGEYRVDKTDYEPVLGRFVALVAAFRERVCSDPGPTGMLCPRLSTQEILARGAQPTAGP